MTLFQQLAKMKNSFHGKPCLTHYDDGWFDLEKEKYVSITPGCYHPEKPYRIIAVKSVPFFKVLDYLPCFAYKAQPTKDSVIKWRFIDRMTGFAIPQILDSPTYKSSRWYAKDALEDMVRNYELTNADNGIIYFKKWFETRYKHGLSPVFSKQEWVDYVNLIRQVKGETNG